MRRSWLIYAVVYSFFLATLGCGNGYAEVRKLTRQDLEIGNPDNTVTSAGGHVGNYISNFAAIPPVVDVRDHGAVGDGTTDDTAAIQAAIDSISAGIVIIPPGTYKITGTLTINDPIHLLGAGISATSLVVAAAVGASTDILKISPTGNVRDIRIADMWIKPASGTPGRYGIYLDTTAAAQFLSYMTIERVRVGAFGTYSVYANMRTDGVTGAPFNSVIRDSFFDGKVKIVRGGDSLIFSNNLFSGQGGGLDINLITGAANLTVEKNVFVGAPGVVVRRSDVQGRIINNYFELQGYVPTATDNAALSLLGDEGGINQMIVTGNQFTLTPDVQDYGIYVDNAIGTNIDKNNIGHGETGQYGTVITVTASHTVYGHNTNIGNSYEDLAAAYRYIDNSATTIGLPHALTFNNLWKNYTDNGLTSTARYLKTQDGMVHLMGYIDNGTTAYSTQMLTVPDGARPSYETYCNVLVHDPLPTYDNVTLDRAALIKIDSAGAVTILSNAFDNTYVVLDGCSYWSDQYR